MSVPYEYGPQRQFEDHDNYQFRTQDFIKNYANKIRMDLTWVAKHCMGYALHLFSVNDSVRCTACTNEATGEKLVSTCSICNGTGYSTTWDYLGRCYGYVDFTPSTFITTETGNTENAGGKKDQIHIIFPKLIHDQSLVLFEDTCELYKIYDTEPLLGMMQGEVISQLAYVSLINYGQAEYKCLEKLPDAYKKWLKPSHENHE